MFGRETQEASAGPAQRQGFLRRLTQRLGRGRLTVDLANLFRGRKIDADLLEEL